MSLIRKHWRAILIVALLGLLGALGALAHWAGSQIASPTRRTIQDYHREFLEHPAAHGLIITRFTASDGTPALICIPDPSGTLGERGTLIRKQLAERGVTLPPIGTITGNLVLCHGRRGRKEDYLPIAERLCACGFRCVVPDLPAHGDHPAPIATYGVREATLPAQILAEASKHFSFNPHPAGLLGMSMGGSVSVHAAALPDAPWMALAVVSSFDSFSKVINSQATQLIGTSFGPAWTHGTGFVYHRKSGIHLTDIQPHQHAARIRIPTLIAHGTADQVADIARGKFLFDSFPTTTPKKWIEIPGAGHDDVFITSYPIYAEISGWMLQFVK